MLEEIYNGPSEGARSIIKGYGDYAENIILARAIPDVRDGLKVVQRRIIYSANQNKKSYMQKSATVVADTMKIHPHGDGAIYGSYVLMTDENGSLNYPFFKALGNLGKCYSSAPAAAMRYTKFMLSENTDIFFRESNVMDLVPSEEGDGVEPTVLPAIFPVVLVNGSTGIAVSAGTNILSFNFHDVLDLTIKYLENGKLDVNDIIMPDFPTGGVLVANNSELAKIMLTGTGKLKVRAKVEIEGKKILVKEVPCGKTAQGIVSSIEKADIKDISSAIVTIGKDSTSPVTITCKTKKVVESVLLKLYQKNILQNSFTSNMLVINDKEPMILGVHDVIAVWSKWRKEIVRKKFTTLIEGLQGNKLTLSYFIRLISNEEWKNNYTNKIIHENKASADDYLHEIFDDIPQDVCNWISERSISAFNKGGMYQNKYDSILKEELKYKNILSDLTGYIVEELRTLKSANIKKFARKTEVSNVDYKFSKLSDSDEIEDTSYCVYTLYTNGFLAKTREHSERSDVLCEVEAQANSVLIGFDNYGRILRLFGKEIPFTTSANANEGSVYLPKYFEASFQDDYKVLYLGLLDGKKRMLVYRDGYIGFLDTSEYYGKKNIKIVSKGVHLAVNDELLHVYEEDEIPEYLVLVQDEGEKYKLGIVNTRGIPERSRLSRSKVLSTTSGEINTEYLTGFKNAFDLVRVLPNMDKFVGKLKYIKDDIDLEVSGGMYLDVL